jgi:hypothetical protein
MNGLLARSLEYDDMAMPDLHGTKTPSNYGRQGFWRKARKSLDEPIVPGGFHLPYGRDCSSLPSPVLLPSGWRKIFLKTLENR